MPTRLAAYDTLRILAASSFITLASCNNAPQPAPPASSDNPVDTVHEWAALDRYATANAGLAPVGQAEERVVLFGDSITEGWAPLFDELFPGKPYVGRGISGQTTDQMLVRFRQDVIDLNPSVVVVLAGTNDIAGNAGTVSLEHIQGNLTSMAELATSNGIAVVLSSVLPVAEYPWRPGLEPAPKIVALNNWIKGYAESHGLHFVDYHRVMADADNGMRPGLADDGVHPNAAGYAVMAPLVEQAITASLDRSRTGS